MRVGLWTAIILVHRFAQLSRALPPQALAGKTTRPHPSVAIVYCAPLAHELGSLTQTHQHAWKKGIAQFFGSRTGDSLDQQNKGARAGAWAQGIEFAAQ